MIEPGDQVEHEEFGIGHVLALLGETATVEFFGETFDVEVGELISRPNGSSPVLTSGPVREGVDLAFRQSFEAVNLGVVPSNPDQLIKLTIGGEQIATDVRSVLDAATYSGASRIFMGYYGSGKSHHLRLVKAIALREGWVTASIELDPKSADPAKPSTVYQELIAGLEFPMRSDGNQSEDFFDLVKEIRDKWMTVRSLKYLKASQWFGSGIEALQFLAHRRDDPEYVSAVNWLGGQVKLISAIRKVTWREGYRGKIPTMPQTKDTGLIYAFHLVVLHEVLKALGYRGLALIIDEAEHVRNYSINRYLRANNFFDVLARCAHPPRKDQQDPNCDYDMTTVPPFWREGPHFGLFVGLTEGEDTQDLTRKTGEMSVLIPSPDEVIHLVPPSAADYETWANRFLTEASSHLGPKVDLLSDPDLCAQIAAMLREHFEQIPDTEKLLRNWTKMAGLPAAVLLSQSAAVGHKELIAIIDDAAKQISGEVMPWDE